MIDTHAHIYLEHFDEDIQNVLDQAEEAGVHRILMPNIDSSTVKAMNQLAEDNPDKLIPMMGLHPCSVKENYRDELKLVEEELRKGGYLAVGEIGTDLYWDKTFWEEQQEAFNIQCELGLELELPVVIHCRETIDETIDLVRPWAEKGLSGVFHCFTGSLDQANSIIDMGFYLGIGGVSTFKNGGLDKVLPDVNKEFVVLETDSPYLAPVPFRGKRNEPSYLRNVAEKLALYWECSFKEVDEITTQNANRLFKLQ